MCRMLVLGWVVYAFEQPTKLGRCSGCVKVSDSCVVGIGVLGS